MRILAYNWRDLTHPQAGGAEVYLQSVAAEWVTSGHDVTIFCAAVAGQPPEELVDGVRIVRRGGRLGVSREARRYWKKEGPGNYDLVIDSVNTRPFLCPRFVKDTPVVAIIHQVAKEVWGYETSWPISMLGRFVLEPAWLRQYRDVPVVTVSKSSRESLEEYGLRRITVVPEGWTCSVRPASIAREHVPTIAFVGRLSPNKRPDHALQAFQLVRNQLPDAALWMMGCGPMEQNLKRSAPEGAVLLGRVSEHEKQARLARSHVLIATSVREGWGLAVTEAAAMGTPAIAYDVPGLRDSVRASGGALTAPTPAALASALVDHLRHAHPCRPANLQALIGGVLPWKDVADAILRTAQDAQPVDPGAVRAR
jgi:glycosyltransferase involved in cell wall biosynthesis